MRSASGGSSNVPKTGHAQCGSNEQCRRSRTCNEGVASFGRVVPEHMLKARVLFADPRRPAVISGTIALGKRAFAIFSKERAASRGAALAFYTVTSIAPILVIIVAVAGLVFGQEAASGAIYQQFSGLLGTEGADLLQKAIAGASSKSGGITATIISVVTLLLGASGVFLELEDALNAIWDAKAPDGLAGMARARLASLGLVIALGFLLIVSLVLDASLKAASGFLPLGAPLMLVLSIVVSV